MRNYLGLACSMHDPALAIVDSEGELRFAEGAERYLQTKRAFNSPPVDFLRANSLIEAYGEERADLVVATTWRSGWLRLVRIGMASLGACHALSSRVSSRTGRAMIGAVTRAVYEHPYEHMRWAITSLSNSASQAEENLREMAVIAELRRAIRAGADPGNAFAGRALSFRSFDHHLTHAAAACYASPFSEAVCAILDGHGEGGSAAFYTYRDGHIDRIAAGPSHASLGQFYLLLCFACGFDPAKGEEWKVMGLAAYGRPNELMYRRLRDVFTVRGVQLLRGPDRRPIYRVLADLRGFPPEDVAAAGQRVFEEVSAELLCNLFRLGLSNNLVLGGGCALNSSNNGHLLSRTGFARLYVAPAPADDGNAAGAAWLAFKRDHPDWRPAPRTQSPYLGSSMSPDTLSRLLKLGGLQKVTRLGPHVHQRTAELLAGGRIVGWIQGRAEFGPRALGNRSILADPRRPEIKDILNSHVKFREDFRPFAPSILHDHGPDYFEGYQEAPYMDRTLPFKPSVREKVPAVVHVDGTGRLQTVKREWNEDFYNLLVEFHKLTGVPLLLNTSLNVMAKPIAHSVEDALGLFLTTGLDALVIGDVLIEK
jgi:carbamoyltransferase